jgi:hypothetical protein
LGYFAQNPSSGLRQVRLVLIDRPTLDAFTQAWDAHFSKPAPAGG